MRSDAQDRAEATAAAAMASMGDYAITPTPQNYAIWYEYHTGHSPSLSRMIDILLSNARPFDDLVLAELHQKFFSSTLEQAALRETSLRIRSTLAEVAGIVQGAGDDASRFGAAVREGSAGFANGATSLPALIQRLMREAQEVAERSELVGDQLRNSVDTIQKLERTLDHARREATTDALTGLANRRAFDMALREAAGAAMNSGEALSLLILDIDRFKIVNDTWGHPVGDQVLRLVAATMRERVRGEDRAARYGGEEFAVILPGVPLDHAASRADGIRQAFVGRQIVLRDTGQSIPGITVSIGVASYVPGERLSAWVARADAALYRAKQGGRNRIATALAA